MDPKAWRADDDANAATLVGAVNDNGRAVYKLLAKHPDARLHDRRVYAACGMAGYSCVGLLGAMGRDRGGVQEKPFDSYWALGWPPIRALTTSRAQLPTRRWSTPLGGLLFTPAPLTVPP